MRTKGQFFSKMSSKRSVSPYKDGASSSPLETSVKFHKGENYPNHIDYVFPENEINLKNLFFQISKNGAQILEGASPVHVWAKVGGETTLVTSGEDLKTTLGTSGEDLKTTLETSVVSDCNWYH